MIEEQFLKHCQEQGYFETHRKVLLAVSGGLDSMFLLHLFYRYQKELDLQIYIAHINHKQRLEADQEEQALKELAGKLKLKIFTASYSGKFSEKAARDFRYDFFKQIMFKENCTALVTAHHADDQAETIFMRILRGSRLLHLSGIKVRQNFGPGELIRPLLTFHKQDFPDLVHFEDCSNQENHYFRNRIRNNYLPALQKENPKIKQTLLDLANQVELLYKALDSLTSDIELTNVSVFKAQEPAVQVYLLETYLRDFPDLQISKAQFAEILQIIRTKANYRHHLKADYELVKDYQDFQIRKISPQPDFASRGLLLKFDSSLDFEGYHFSFGQPLFGEGVQVIPLASKKDLFLRHRQTGDEILLEGHHRKLRRFFINQKIPEAERQKAIIVEQDKKIVAIAKMAVSDLSKLLKSDIIKSNLYIQKIDR